MKIRASSIAWLLPILAAFPIGGCARPTLLDGAFDGTLDCTDSGTHTVSALFDEQADGDVDGQMYIEDIAFFGGELTVRADLDGGEYDPDDDEYSFDLQTDDDDAAEFAGTLQIDNDDPDDVTGDVEQFDADQPDEVVQTCDLRLSRVSRTDN